MGYALVKLNDNAHIYQDMRWGKWIFDDGDTLENSPVWLGEKKYSIAHKRAEWTLTRYGHGMHCEPYDNKSYGSGPIITWGEDCVTLLTPVLGYKPELTPEGEE